MYYGSYNELSFLRLETKMKKKMINNNDQGNVETNLEIDMNIYTKAHFYVEPT